MVLRPGVSHAETPGIGQQERSRRLPISKEGGPERVSFCLYNTRKMRESQKVQGGMWHGNDTFNIAGKMYWLRDL